MKFTNNVYNKAFAENADNVIWVAKYGSDEYSNGRMGDIDCPYASIDAAVAAMTATKNTVIVLPGSYTLSDKVTCSISGGQIVGIGKPTIVAAKGKDAGFVVAMAATAGTKEFTFDNLCIDHSDDNAQVGIQVDNVAMTAKLNLYLNDLEFNSDGGNSLDVDHAATDDAIRVYANRSGFEGPVNAEVGNDADRFRFEDSTLRGGLVTNDGEFEAEIMCKNCIIKEKGISGGAVKQRLFLLGCYSETDEDPNDYAYIAASDTTGYHDASIIPIEGSGDA
jgi:pectin methylesterase-like acyl-CoA thioesterase